MGLFVFFRKHMDINVFCRCILDNKITLFVSSLFLEKHPDWVGERCFGNVNVDILIQLIDLGLEDARAFPALEQILEAASESSMTDMVLERILKFPVLEKRQIFLIALFHKKLTEKQLLLLCDTVCAFECFFELASLYYTDSKYSLNVFSDFLFKFSQCKFSEMLNDLIYELLNCYTPSSQEKKEFVVNWSKNAE